MDTIKTIIASGLVALFVALAAVVVAPKSENMPQVTTKENLGAFASPDSPSPYVSWGGVRQWAGSTGLNIASTTVCALRSPTAATSTLVFADIRLDVSSTSASTVTFAKSTTGNGSTTPFNSFSVSAGAQATLALPATTTTAGMLNYTFAPGVYFTATMGAGNGTYSPSGQCKAIFVEV